MTYIPFLFNQTIEQMRRIGSRGGKTHARNWRARQGATLAGPRDTPQPAAPPQETTSQAMALLDAQFAWLRGAEKPVRQRRMELPNSGPSLVGPQGIYRNIRSVYYASPLTNG